jgi:hypothetical protein
MLNSTYHVTQIIHKATPHVREMLRDFLLLFASCWPEVSKHPADPATGHLDTRFSGFLVSSSKGRDGWAATVPSAAACVSCIIEINTHALKQKINEMAK